MELLTQLLQALWAQDFETLANPSLKTACFRRPFYRATVYWYWSAY